MYFVQYYTFSINYTLHNFSSNELPRRVVAVQNFRAQGLELIVPKIDNVVDVITPTGPRADDPTTISWQNLAQQYLIACFYAWFHNG